VDLTGDDVQDILRLLDTLPFSELHLETTRFKLSLRRAPDGGWTQETQVLAAPKRLPDPAGTAAPATGQAAAAPTLHAAPAPALQAAPAPALQAAPDAPDQGIDDGLADVRCPLLGTFYRAPRPGAPPFVDVGSAVDEHTVVGIVETMKLMNSVAAGVSGTVAEIVAANAQFAEQGTVLMRIRPDR
jgi:acetyl-CoA carboxylase biotin carboxyl carrier protein